MLDKGRHRSVYTSFCSQQLLSLSLKYVFLRNHRVHILREKPVAEFTNARVLVATRCDRFYLFTCRETFVKKLTVRFGFASL